MISLLKVFGAFFRGGLVGVFVFGMCGLLVSGVGELFLRQLGTGLPTWSHVLAGMVPPTVLALAGAYILAIRSALGAIAEEFVEHDVTQRLFDRIRPALLRVASALKERSTPLRHSKVVRTIQEQLERQQEAEPTTWREQAVQSAVCRAEAAVASLLIATPEQSNDPLANAHALEQATVERLEQVVAELVENLYLTQLVAVLALAVLLSTCTYLTLWAI